MRNIIFTSLAAAILAGSALAQDAGPPFGCYHRDYNDAHLKKQPNQVVDWMTLHIYRDQHGQHVAGLRVMTANQGHAARSGHGGQIYDQWLFCWADGHDQGCSVECDGGHFVVTRDTGKSLTIQTSGLWVGDVESCGGAVDIAELPRTPVKYRLDRVSDSACDGI